MDPMQCKATKRSGDRCGNPPIKGATVCRMHGGKAPQVVAATARRRAEADALEQLEGAVTTLGLPQDIDPGKALLDEIARTHGIVLWLQAKVRELEPDELVWGKAQHEHGRGPEGPIDKTTEKAEYSAWYKLYAEERDRLARVSAMALKAGIEARRIALAESQGSMVADALRRILDALNLTPEQSQLVPMIVPRELRALADVG